MIKKEHFFPHSNGFTAEKRRILMHNKHETLISLFPCRLTTAVESHYTIRIHRKTQENCVVCFLLSRYWNCLQKKKHISDRKRKALSFFVAKKVFLTDGEEREKGKRAISYVNFGVSKGLCSTLHKTDFTAIILFKKSDFCLYMRQLTMGKDSREKETN